MRRVEGDGKDGGRGRTKSALRVDVADGEEVVRVQRTERTQDKLFVSEREFVTTRRMVPGPVGRKESTRRDLTPGTLAHLLRREDR